MAASDTFLTRLAGPADYSDVLSVSKGIYSGADYIASVYRVFQHGPKCYMFLSELNGKPVCFTFSYILNDGQTLLHGGGRTLSDHRGKGHYKTHIANVTTFFQNLNLQVTEEAITSVDVEFHQKKLNDKTLNRRLVAKHPEICFRGTREKVLRAAAKHLKENSAWLGKTYKLGVQDAINVLLDTDNIERLFYQSHFTATTLSLILKPTSKNLVWLAKNNVVVATKIGTGNTCEIISHSHLIGCPGGTSLCIYVHGHEKYESRLHSLLHIAHACEVSRTENILITVQLTHRDEHSRSRENLADFLWLMSNLDLIKWSDADKILVLQDLKQSAKL